MIGGVLTWVAGAIASPMAVAAAGVLTLTGTKPLNKGEDERARQERFRKGSAGPPMPAGVFPEKVPGKPSDKGKTLSGKPAIRFDTSEAAKGALAGGIAKPLEVVGRGDVHGVDKRLLNTMAAAADLPAGYKVQIFSGIRPHGPASSAHKTGRAIDVQIVDPHGHVIKSRGEDTTGMYRRLARYTYAEMKARYPDLAESKLAWGGSFGTALGGGGESDLMHFDIMRARGGIRASHYAKIQDLGALPIGPHESAQRHIFGHPHKKPQHDSSLGYHPAHVALLHRRPEVTIDMAGMAGTWQAEHTG